jgi:hypothetical protein
MDDERDYLEDAKEKIAEGESLQALAAAAIVQAEELRTLRRMLDSQSGPPYASITVDGTLGLP